MNSSTRRYFRKAQAVAAALLLSLGLAGCGGVELQGGIFDALGVGSNSKSSAEPKLARRNGLVVPPDRQALPTPGSAPKVASAGDLRGTQAGAGQQSWPKDPEEAKVAQATQRQQLIAKYCGEADWWKRSNPEKFNRMTQNGALCQSSLSKYFGKKTNTQ